MSDQNLKVPSQVFRWFEKMKGNYEQSVQMVLSKFERQTAEQQSRLDKEHSQHIENIKQQHLSQLADKQQHINQLSEEIAYYKQQLEQQNQSMVQLNTRYDAVMSCLLSEKRKDINIKDIFNDDLLLNDDTEQPAESSNHDKTVQEIFEQGIALRDQHDYLSAFMLFEQAAQLGYAKAMGAMGRAYFLAEGCEENQVFGLAWLIEAAKHGLAPAIDRVNVFKESDAELYHDALAINQALTKNNA